MAVQDLVLRLRAEDPETGLRHSLACEAADYIERLESALMELAQAYDTGSNDVVGCMQSIIDEFERRIDVATAALDTEPETKPFALSLIVDNTRSVVGNNEST